MLKHNPILLSYLSASYSIINFNVIASLSDGKQEKSLQLGLCEKEPYDISFAHYSYTSHCNWYCLSFSWYVDISHINSRESPC